ncbi:MAG: YlxR family protein [Candidatus Promineifilaceae bacterium]|nr:YlxR family protein [Candidatus Promineifilaceae bacterium]
MRLKHTPQRTCIACRQKSDKRELTRIVRTPEGAVIVDATGRQAGRGAYLCNRESCWDRATRTPLLERALRAPIAADERLALAAHRPEPPQIASS